MVNCSLRIYLVRKTLVCTVIDTDYNGEDWLQNTIIQFLISVLYTFELDRPKSDKTTIRKTVSNMTFWTVQWIFH